MIHLVIAVLNFFAPQKEFGFWSWAIGFTFFALGLCVSFCTKNQFLRLFTPFLGILLLLDETQQGHECFSEYTRFSPLLYIKVEMLLVVPFAIFWFSEKSLHKRDIKYFIIGGLSLFIAVFLRFNMFPPNFKILEELAEFSTAATTFLYVIKNNQINIRKRSLIAWCIFLSVAILICDPVRVQLCPRVEYWVQILSYF